MLRSPRCAFARLCCAFLVTWLLSTSTAIAQTDVPAGVIVDLHWRANESPFQITEDVVVPAGATLTIDPGVTVQLGEGVTLHVDGTLHAEGSAAKPIAFTKLTLSPWLSIELGAESTGIIRHARFNTAVAAIRSYSPSLTLEDLSLIHI